MNDLLHRPLVLRADGEAEDVEVRDVAYLVLGEGDPAAEVPRDGEGAVGRAEFPAVEGRPDQGRLELVAVELDGAAGSSGRSRSCRTWGSACGGSWRTRRGSP